MLHTEMFLIPNEQILKGRWVKLLQKKSSDSHKNATAGHDFAWLPNGHDHIGGNWRILVGGQVSGLLWRQFQMHVHSLKGQQQVCKNTVC